MEDVRITKSKLNIENTFIQLLKEKSFAKITIKDICTVSMTSRSTFYSHYLDKYDLLEKIVQRFVQSFEEMAEQRFDRPEKNFKELLEEGCKFYLQNQEELKVLLHIHVPNGDLNKEIEKILLKKCHQFLEQNYPTKAVPNQLIARIYIANVLALANWIIEDGGVLNKEISQVLDTFQAQFFHLLLE